MEYELYIKIVVLGDAAVGKTSIVNRFLLKTYPTKYLATLGHTIFRKDYILSEKKIQLLVWDVGGLKAFNELNRVVYKDVDAAIIVFDLSRVEETLKNIKKEYLDKLEENSEEYLSIIAGNKLDLVSMSNELKKNIEDNLSKEDQLLLISAKTGENVNESFEFLVYNILMEKGDDKMAKDFINLTGKKETELSNLVLNLDSM
ncbi:MAG: Rab family GTPase [Promethearchaeota archaeon]